MSDVKITVFNNGPFRVEGDVTLVDADGKEFTKKEKFSLCRCGQSSNKPYCDGTHNKIGFESTVHAQ